eukprot:298299-Pelagomonas_calceolata.AAC.2
MTAQHQCVQLGSGQGPAGKVSGEAEGHALEACRSSLLQARKLQLLIIASLLIIHATPVACPFR